MSDETLRKAGRAELDRLNGGAKKAAAPAPKKRKQIATSYADLAGIGKKKTVRRVDQMVDEAVENAKPDNY